MVIFLYGEDTFRSRQYLHRLLDKFKAERDPFGLNVVMIDAAASDATGNEGDIMREILTVPFLAERKLIVVQNLLVSHLEQTQTQLAGRIRAKTLPDSNVVVLWESTNECKGKEAKALFELLKKEKYCEEFKPLAARALARWLEAEVKARGGSIAHAAISYLTTHLGADMWTLDRVIDQLVAYATPREITVTDLKEFVPRRTDDNIFNLVDAMVARQPSPAYAMIREQYKKGEDSQYVFAMLIRQFRILLQLRDLFEREDGLSSADLAKRLSLHPFVVKKSLLVVKRYTLFELKAIYERLLDIDIRSKTGAGKLETLLDLVVGEIAYSTKTPT